MAEKVIKYDVDGAPIVWHEVDTNSLVGAQLKAWQEYKKAYAAASAHRAEFETLLRKEAASKRDMTGRRLVVGYNFGKLSVSNMVDDGGGNKASKRAKSLSEALAG